MGVRFREASLTGQVLLAVEVNLNPLTTKSILITDERGYVLLHTCQEACSQKCSQFKTFLTHLFWRDVRDHCSLLSYRKIKDRSLYISAQLFWRVKRFHCESKKNCHPDVGISHLFMSTVVRVKLTPFSQSIIKSR